METKTGAVIFSLRIPADLNGKIIAEAKKQKRTRQAQIEVALEEIFKNGNKSKEKTK